VRSSTILFVVFLAFAAVLAAPPAPVIAAHHRVIRVAPADEYFGRLKMSILGIRNQLHDLSLRLQYAPNKSEDVLGSAAFVEDALRDWEHKYPQDPWLPKSVYELASLYTNVHTPYGQEKAASAMRWLLARYGRTAYGAQARAQIHVGLR
jgi:hypothetical protein